MPQQWALEPSAAPPQGRGPPAALEEHWRNVYVDVTSPADGVSSPAFVASLAAWLVAEQPITVALNDEDGGLELGRWPSPLARSP